MTIAVHVNILYSNLIVRTFSVSDATATCFEPSVEGKGARFTNWMRVTNREGAAVPIPPHWPYSRKPTFVASQIGKPVPTQHSQRQHGTSRLSAAFSYAYYLTPRSPCLASKVNEPDLGKFIQKLSISPSIGRKAMSRLPHMIERIASSEMSRNALNNWEKFKLPARNDRIENLLDELGASSKRARQEPRPKPIWFCRF